MAGLGPEASGTLPLSDQPFLENLRAEEIPQFMSPMLSR